jgi:hypothetical protein
MDSEWSYEIRSSKQEEKAFVVLVHHYRHLGPVSTHEEIEFETFQDLTTWLRETLNA